MSDPNEWLRLPRSAWPTDWQGRLRKLAHPADPPPNLPPNPQPKEPPKVRTRTVKKTAVKKTTARKTPVRKAAPPPGRKVRVEVDDPGNWAPEVAPPAGWTPPIRVDEDATRSPDPSPCRVCGAEVQPDSHHDRWGPWRVHTACSKVAAYPPARVKAAAAALGFGDLPIEDAALINVTVSCYSDTFDGWNPPGTRDRRTRPTVYPDGTKVRDKMPWRHIDRKGLAKAIKDLPRRRLEAGVDPTRCESGPCCVCGVVEAVGWTETELRWPDGTVAPACGDCHAVYIKYGETAWPDDLAMVVAECLTTVPNTGETTPDQMVPFIGSGVTATGERWPHLNPEAVEAYRWAVWTRSPGQAPAEHRAEARRRQVEEREAQVAARVAREQEEKEAADVWGFRRVSSPDTSPGSGPGSGAGSGAGMEAD